MKKTLFLLCFVLLCACARHAPQQNLPQEQLAMRWQTFTARTTPSAPYRMQMSLRFGTEGDTRRVTAIFWGNSARELRLDVMAGVGVTVAKILEDGQHFLVYSPRENKAYFHQGANKPLLRVGVPIPFNLEHLADLLNGRYAQTFGSEYGKAFLANNGTACYDLQGQLGGRLALDAQGLPVSWQEQPEGQGWRMDIVYGDEAIPLPHRLNLVHSNGKRAVVLVKEREKPAALFTRDQLALPIPKTAPLLPLSQYKRS